MKQSSEKPSPMARMSAPDQMRLIKVEGIRRHNNGLWMNILRIALEADPKQTNALLRGINKNDASVTRLLKQVAKRA